MFILKVNKINIIVCNIFSIMTSEHGLGNSNVHALVQVGIKQLNDCYFIKVYSPSTHITVSDMLIPD